MEAVGARRPKLYKRGKDPCILLELIFGRTNRVKNTSPAQYSLMSPCDVSSPLREAGYLLQTSSCPPLADYKFITVLCGSSLRNGLGSQSVVVNDVLLDRRKGIEIIVFPTKSQRVG